MQKQMSSKKIVIAICMAVVIIIAAVVILLSGKEEFYRSVLVYELEGKALIERVDVGAIDAAENLYLEFGDRVSVQDESMMRMKLDNDKYITAEANTVFSLEAKGNEQDSETRINLEQGAITNEIQNPLSTDSFYETTTPNSVMAVRGTIYRAHLYDDGKGGQDMKVCCFQGTVAAIPVLPDGTKGEEVLVHAGNELIIDSEGNAGALMEIDFSTLPEQALQMLKALLENGTSVEGISEEELSKLLAVFDEDNLSPDAEESAVEDDEDDIQENSDAESADIDENGEKNISSVDGANAGKKKGNSGQSTKNTGNKVKNTGNETGKNPQNAEADKKSQNAEPDSGKTPDSSDNGNSNGDSQGDGKGGNSGSKPKKPSKDVSYTVTYKYQGTVFATQTVKKGDKAVVPVLTPAAEGAWNFNFDTKITSDTTIEWQDIGGAED